MWCVVAILSTFALENSCISLQQKKLMIPTYLKDTVGIIDCRSQDRLSLRKHGSNSVQHNRVCTVVLELIDMDGDGPTLYVEPHPTP